MSAKSGSEDSPGVLSKVKAGKGAEAVGSLRKKLKAEEASRREWQSILKKKDEELRRIRTDVEAAEKRA